MNFSTIRVRPVFQSWILKRRRLGFCHDTWGRWKAFSVEIVCLNLDVFRVVITGFFLDGQTFFFSAREHIIAANHFRTVKESQYCAVNKI